MSEREIEQAAEALLERLEITDVEMSMDEIRAIPDEVWRAAMQIVIKDKRARGEAICG